MTIVSAIASARVPCAATLTTITIEDMGCFAIHVNGQMLIVIIALHVLGGASDLHLFKYFE
jgi:hypothetical protein